MCYGCDKKERTFFCRNIHQLEKGWLFIEHKLFYLKKMYVPIYEEYAPLWM